MDGRQAVADFTTMAVGAFLLKPPYLSPTRTSTVPSVRLSARTVESLKKALTRTTSGF